MQSLFTDTLCAISWISFDVSYISECLGLNRKGQRQHNSKRSRKQMKAIESTSPLRTAIALRLVPSSLIQQLDGVLTMHWDLVEAGSQGQGREDVERSQKKGSFGPRALKGLRVPKGSF